MDPMTSVSPLVTLPGTDLSVHRLNLGGNPFGWGADKDTSYAVLDAYVAAGGNFVDTADMYTCWVPGCVGGESETIIGQWMKDRGNRDSMVIATKVGMLDGKDNLDPANIRACVEDSLTRLQTDYIDLYYAHQDDPNADQLAVAQTFDALVQEGKVRHLAASNFTLERLASARRIQQENGLATYAVIQNRYNLLAREDYSLALEEYIRAEGMGELPFASLAAGFLTGKHLDEGGAEGSARTGVVAKFLEDPTAVKAVELLRAIAAAHGTSPTAVALAWQLSHDTIPSTIASARVTEQVPDLMAGAALELTADEVAALTAVAPR